MSRSALSLLPLLAVIAMAGASDVAPPPRAPVRSRSYALAGDSLAVGLTPHLRTELAPKPLDARPRGGTTALDWLSGKDAPKLDAALAARPTHVLISLGTNDLAGKVPQDKLDARFLALADKCRKAGAEPVFLEPPPYRFQRELIRRAAKAAGARIISGPAVQMQEDNVHPTPRGSKSWAQHIRKELGA